MEEALIKRVLPHSIEAEQAVIGAMLMDKEAILTASEIISGKIFISPLTEFCLRQLWSFSMKASRWT